MTFDPVFLAQKGALGFAHDVAQAREWYDRAIKLGSTDAARHIERLAKWRDDGLDDGASRH
jgi:hypothetical protein